MNRKRHSAFLFGMELAMKKALVFISVMICVFFALGVSAFADMGPKPSVTVYVNGVEDGREYYIALIEKQQYNINFTKENDDVWKKINDFSQAEGYCLTNRPVDNPYNKMSGRDSAWWGYMPPQTFKILLYFPDSESFLVSGVVDKYAFDSYYTVEVNGGALSVAPYGGAKGIVVEGCGLLVRIALTVLIEIGVAVGFGYRAKSELKLILITNIITQVLLNALIAFGDNTLGGLGAVFAYIVGEIVVFVAEAIVYSVKLPIISEVCTSRGAVGYAFIANLASFFGGGLLLAMTEMLFKVIVGG